MHHLVDGNGRPLVTLVGPGQAGDAPIIPHLMRHLRIRRTGRGRARTRPVRVRGDKAYSSRAIRRLLRTRGIAAVIPEPADQAGHRKRRGSRGGRPPAFDAVDHVGATSSNTGSTCANNGAAWQLATTSSPSSTGRRSSCMPWSPGLKHCQTRPGTAALVAHAGEYVGIGPEPVAAGLSRVQAANGSG
ncbi:transposase [Amycolatopsis lexingtonensis]|uniref:transposase n=1 Tax=Amycolatopsis lexingtonensis TaxID=218822 RepID=UPI003B838043